MKAIVTMGMIAVLMLATAPTIENQPEAVPTIWQQLLKALGAR